MDQQRLSAPLVLEYPFNRTTGDIVGAAMTGLREGIILGVRRSDGSVMVPPLEYDPETGASLHELVEVGQDGTVLTWTWLDEPRPQSPWSRPHGLALILLDGADTPMLHGVLAESADRLRIGMRVRASWRTERHGHPHDIEGFVPVGDV